jgi:hypothetical protein
MTHDSHKAAAEAEDAAVHNMRAGNIDLGQAWAIVSIMHRLSAQDHHFTIKPGDIKLITGSDPESMAQKLDANIYRTPKPRPVMPTAPGVYQDREGIPWYRTKVESDRPWMDLTHGHSEERWFTDEYAAQYAPFTRMEAVA